MFPGTDSCVGTTGLSVARPGLRRGLETRGAGTEAAACRREFLDLWL